MIKNNNKYFLKNKASNSYQVSEYINQIGNILFWIIVNKNK